ncbi:DUF7108 domain-containing protein [Salinirubrum litoreum]|uniref:RnhA operon protein n=1 Tax=Salinirubrum litoreum TaxID=1126234 RepID=A0ABD5RD54_9EURY|nr:rnhA operon protein [Salinirubrum litoreum]
MAELPDDIVDEAERLTRLARQATEAEEATLYEDRREAILAAHEFRARVRDADDTLVLHPEEWLDDGTVQFDRIEDTDRAVEVSLSGPGDPEAWDDVERHNAELVAAVERDHGPVHAANARVFADFAGNHYAKRVDAIRADAVEEFLTEYYPRNAWPSAEQKAVIEESLRLLFETADAEVPGVTGDRR